MAWIVHRELRRSLSFGRRRERGGSDAVYYGRKLCGATNEGEDDSDLRAPSAAMAGYERLNERATERTRVLGMLDRWLGERFSG